MNEFFSMAFWNYLFPFLGALVATLLLVPIVRRINMHLGMVDMPSARRINKKPVARGGGVALVVGVIGTYAAFTAIAGVHPIPGVEGFGGTKFWQLMLIAVFVATLGYLDDKFSLPPRVKLAGQLVAASLVWWWIGLGFSRLFPALPAWLDFLMTVFWITGAVNAFNLIDGLDGLASGLALIATLGMTGSLFLLDKPSSTMFYFAFAGGLLGFLRYNYNPASIFLGDSGSMFIGFILATMPLVLQSPDSLLVSVGMPLLAMGVPIFDTAVAILRRYLRRILEKRSGLAVDGKGRVMTADTDHTHHRILRAAGLNQRKAALVLYGVAVFFVAVGLVGMSLKSRAAGLWLFAVAAASIVVFKDIARVELFDAGKILRDMAFTRDIVSRRRIARLSIPFHVAFDVASLVAAYFAYHWIFDIPLAKQSLRVVLPIRAFAVFACLVFFRTYRTAWARAMLSNYARLLVACLFGSALGAVAIYYAPVARTVSLRSTTPVYAMTVFVLLLLVRVARPIVRDLFYAIDCNRMYSNPGVSRILVYGSGLRYRAFRRELVRGASANDRMIVGLIDDDILLRGQYIGGIRVLGTLFRAPEIIRKHRVDTVVIACEFPAKWMRVVRKTLEPTGVAITRFSLSEEVISSGERPARGQNRDRIGK